MVHHHLAEMWKSVKRRITNILLLLFVISSTLAIVSQVSNLEMHSKLGKIIKGKKKLKKKGKKQKENEDIMKNKEEKEYKINKRDKKNDKKKN